MRKTKTVLFAIIALAAVGYAAHQIATSPRWLVDDAYILLRYAENLAEHGELNWNPGENPVEGYTGVALAWLLAAGIEAGIPPVALTHAIGVFFFFLGALVLLAALRRSNLASAVALSLYLTVPFYHIHAWSGLETTMFTAAMLLCLFAFTERRERLFIFSLLFVSLVRPEGILLAVLLLPLYRPFSWKRMAWYLVPFGVYFAWRWAYYGRLLPNTFYAKVTAPTDEDTASSLLEFAKTYLLLPGILLLVYIPRQALRRHWRPVAATAGFTAVCLVTYASSHLVMNFQYRFFAPFYALAILALGAVLRRARMNVRLVVLVVIFVVPQLAINTRREPIFLARDYAATHRRLLEDEHIPIGRYLRNHMPRDEWLVVHADAGSIPYHSKLRTVDFGRLNDEFLANRGRTEREAVDYFFERDPGAAVFTSREYHSIDHGREANAIIRDRRFLGRYKLLARYSSRERKGYYEFLYLRNDLAGKIPPPDNIRSMDPRGETGYGVGTEDDPGARLSNRPDDDELLDTPERLWRHAQETTNEDLRLAALRKLIRRFPDDARVPEARWETVIALDDATGRIDGLRDIVERYPGTELAAKALFTMGFIFAEELADTSAARERFERVIERYPDAEVAESARWMLQALTDTARPDLD